MKVTVVMEDTPGKEGLINEHGLCFYIETAKHRILLDTGASQNTWINAGYLGIEIESVDMVVLSHGHYDHSGGITAFAQKHPNTKIYLQKEAGDPHYHIKGETVREIGIDPVIVTLKQCETVEGSVVIDEEVSLFSEIRGRRLWPSGNRGMFRCCGGKRIEDDFGHEQCLVIRENGKNYLFSGCAHNGILNILDRYREQYREEPAAVFSGFHMMKKEEYTEEEKETIRQTAVELSKTGTAYYTGHCTSEEAYRIMMETEGTPVTYFHTGDSFVFE